MLAARKLVGVASEMNLRERVTQTQSAKPTLALKPSRRRHQKPKTEASVASQKGLMSSKD